MALRPPFTPKVLIVDDRKDILNTLKMCLEQFGFESASALSGGEALDLVTKTKFDLILLDVDMPVMDGFEVCRKLKANKTTSLIPVVFVSGRTGFNDREEAMKCGAVDFLPKPFDLLSLKECVLEALSDNQESTLSQGN